MSTTTASSHATRWAMLRAALAAATGTFAVLSVVLTPVATSAPVTLAMAKCNHCEPVLNR